MNIFEEEYKKLNPSQREAVEAIDGPVMVVAGPGTGKTQILAVRIANILTKTDIKADSILCLTFTNSGVKAMRERLRKYISSEASKVYVSTFHSFGMDIVEKYFRVLGYDGVPKIIDEKDAIALCDRILQENDWKYIRPRSDVSRYFKDLKNLISLLKRERMNPIDFEQLIKKEINTIENDENSRSSRGATKGEFKKDVERKIEGLSRTLEAVKFYVLYEQAKKEKHLFDYDDVLESLVKIVEVSEEAASFIQEQYQYILIDEHQDSSGVQNEFLEKVWGKVEKPNIFVVGDDRQLIYGFSGASIEYFDNFKHTFGKAKLINLVENYRSTQPILDFAHLLLQSSMTNEKLRSNNKERHPLRLIEANYPRDEIISGALEIKEKIKNGMNPEEIAILVPKNRQVRSTITILTDMGIPVASSDKINFFDSEVAKSLLRILKIISSPEDSVALAESLFDPLSDISPTNAHKFISKNKMRGFSLLDMKKAEPTLFKNENDVEEWLEKLKSWIAEFSHLNVYSLIQTIGSQFLLDTAKDHKNLVIRVEVIRTLLHLALFEIEKNSKLTLKEFLIFMDRLESYGEDLPIAVFSAEEGVKVLTLHGSKGLEFEYVWVAHLDEKSLSGAKHNGFVLPLVLEEKTEKKDTEVLKRELYVAITRAKRFCTLSYSLHSYTGGDLELADIISDLENSLVRQEASVTEKIILKNDPRIYTEKKSEETSNVTLKELKKLVAKDYEDRKVSVSLLNNFFECPWKWYFRNLLQLPEPQAESMEFGNIVHGSINKILNATRATGEIKETQIKEIVWKETIKTGFGEEKKQIRLAREAFGVVSKWVKNSLPQISKNKESEQSVSQIDKKFPRLTIYGKIDLIEMLNVEEVRVTDFKTGSVRKKSEIEKLDEEGRMSDYMRQLVMYSYLLSENLKWKKNVIESRLEFVETKDTKEVFYKTFIDKDKINLLVSDISDYDKLVKSGEWTARPCNFKSFGKSGAVCEYCKMAEIYQ